MSPDRRTVIKGIGAGVVVVGGGLVGRWLLDDDEPAVDGPPTTEPPPPEAASSLADALVAVGSRYLEDTPDEADQQVLLAELPALDGTVPERPSTGLQVLSPQAAADHETGQVVVLDGWVLSVTEARASGLYAV